MSNWTEQREQEIQGRALTSVTEDMVERAAEAIFLRGFLRRNSWATEARARVSLDAAKAGHIGGWKAVLDDARAALDAAYRGATTRPQEAR